jgi:dihydroflavonol-4-reductase
MAHSVLVTGATGQIGAALAHALLQRGDRVRCLVRDPERARRILGAGYELAAGDLDDAASLAAALRGVQTVCHLAGRASYWPARAAEMREVNVHGTARLLDACATTGVTTMLYTSSIATLGWVAGDEQGDETTAYNWQRLGIAYFDTKYEAEQMVLADPRVAAVVVNPGLVFGAGDRNGNALRFLREVAAGVPGFPPGATTAAVLADVVAGHLAALDRGRPGERYILGGSPVSFQALFAAIAGVTGVVAPQRRLPPWMLHTLALAHTSVSCVSGREPRISLPTCHILTRNRRYRCDKAIAELGYSVSPLAAGLQACWEWHLKHQHGE